MRNRHFIFSAIGAMMLIGCSTQSRTVRTETVYEPVPTAGVTSANAVRTTESTETRTERQSEPSGLLSGTVDVVGKTIALPFRIVGGLIDLAF